MSRFVLSSPSNSALLPSLRIAHVNFSRRPAPFTATLVHEHEGLPTFDRRVCAGCSSRMGGSEPGRQSCEMQLRD